MNPFQDVPKQCRKCGHPRSPDTTAPDAACPSCGAIYAKVEVQFKAREAAAAESKASVELHQENAAWEKANAKELNVIRPAEKRAATLGHIVYLLFAVPLGFTSIVGVAIAHVMVSDARNSLTQSHFRWQIATFWWGALWAVVLLGLGYLMSLGSAFAFAKQGAAVGFMGLLGAAGVYKLLGLVLGIWLLYRIVKGWVYLFRGNAI